MEDKLIKNHHGAAYYYFRKISTFFGIFLVSSAIVAIPISVAASIRAVNESNVEKEKEKETNNITQDSEKDLLRF